MKEKKKLVVFQDKNIRRIWHDDEWWFSVVDVVAVLTDSPTPRQYWGKVKDREFKELELSPIWVQLKLEAPDGKQYVKKLKQRDSELDSNWGTICTPLKIPTRDGKIRESNCTNICGAF